MQRRDIRRSLDGASQRRSPARLNPQNVEPYSYDERPSYKDPMHTIAPESDTLYNINMKVKYKCNPGEKIGISGNIPELGLWK